MNGSNLLDNLDEKIATPRAPTPAPVSDSISTPTSIPVADPAPASAPANEPLQIPIEDTPDVDVTAETTLDISGASDSKTTKPVGRSSMSYEDSKMDFLKKRASIEDRKSYTGSSPDKSDVDSEDAKLTVNKRLPFNLNMDAEKIKSFALNFLVPIISFGVSLILTLTIVAPNWRNLPEMKVELGQKQSLQATLSQKLSDLERLIDFKEIVDEDSALIDSVLVSEEMVPELLSEVDHIAREANLEVSRLSYALSQAGSGTLGYTAVDVSLGVSGTPAQLTNFFKLTENAARLIDVSIYRYSLGSSGENVLSINLVLRSPYLYVSSEAVTDEPVDLDVTSASFMDFVAKLRGLTYYDPEEITKVDVVVETTAEPEIPVNAAPVVVDEAAIPSAP